MPSQEELQSLHRCIRMIGFTIFVVIWNFFFTVSKSFLRTESVNIIVRFLSRRRPSNSLWCTTNKKEGEDIHLGTYILLYLGL